MQIVVLILLKSQDVQMIQEFECTSFAIFTGCVVQTNLQPSSDALMPSKQRAANFNQAFAAMMVLALAVLYCQIIL